MKKLQVVSVLAVFLLTSLQAQAGFLTTAVAAVVISKGAPKVIEKVKDNKNNSQKK